MSGQITSTSMSALFQPKGPLRPFWSRAPHQVYYSAAKSIATAAKASKGFPVPNGATSRHPEPMAAPATRRTFAPPFTPWPRKPALVLRRQDLDKPAAEIAIPDLKMAMTIGHGIRRSRGKVSGGGPAKQNPAHDVRPSEFTVWLRDVASTPEGHAARPPDPHRSSGQSASV